MKLLIITHQYQEKSKEKESTRVINDFAESFAELNNDVYVLNIRNNYWWIKFLPNILLGYLESNFDVKPYFFTNGIKTINTNLTVEKIAINKTFPSKMSEKARFRLFHHINHRLRSINFEPQQIIVHWEDPYSYIGNLIADYYKVNSSIVIHNTSKLSLSNLKSILQFNCIGFRSLALKNDFQKKINKSNLKVDQNLFLCPSGIENPISPVACNGNFNSFLYVGSFIKRKYPEIILPALTDSGVKFEKVQFIGSGSRKKNLERYLENPKISIRGRLTKEQVFIEMENSDCLIMVSKNEAFGLVYLEAMARGNIVVASNNSGMSGIIKDGDNGFLCEAGNLSQLTSLLKEINNLSEIDRTLIKQRAIATALEYEKTLVAKKYLDKITR